MHCPVVLLIVCHWLMHGELNVAPFSYQNPKYYVQCCVIIPCCKNSGRSVDIPHINVHKWQRVISTGKILKETFFFNSALPNRALIETNVTYKQSWRNKKKGRIRNFHFHFFTSSGTNSSKCVHCMVRVLQIILCSLPSHLHFSWWKFRDHYTLFQQILGNSPKSLVQVIHLLAELDCPWFLTFVLGSLKNIQSSVWSTHRQSH